jgi:hypothetical protein
MFSQLHPKATKSRSRDAFNFVLQESQLLEKKLLPESNPLVWLLTFWSTKAKAKSQTKHTLSVEARSKEEFLLS